MSSTTSIYIATALTTQTRFDAPTQLQVLRNVTDQQGLIGPMFMPVAAEVRTS
jgi:hypothetical protein